MEGATNTKRLDDCEEKGMIHRDKIKHFSISFLLVAVIYWLSQNLVLAILMTLLFGLAKELYDQAKGKNNVKESIADFAVNILGITIGLLFTQYILLNL